MYLREMESIFIKNKYETLQSSASFCIWGRREPLQDKFIIVVNNYGKLFSTKYDIDKIKRKIAICPFYQGLKEQKYLFVLRQENINYRNFISGSRDILYFSDDGGVKCVNCDPCFKEEISQIVKKGKEVKDKVKLMKVNGPWRGTDTPIVTILLCLISIGIFVIGYNAEEFGVSPVNLFEKEKWNTLITYMFFHGNIVHLIGNMVSMIIWGSCLEKRIGSGKFLILCLISGVYGGFVSSICKAAFNSPEVVTIGISGVVYAIMGAYIVCQIKNKKPYGLIFTYILCSLMFGFLQPCTDNIVHIIGLAYGIYCMAIFYLLRNIYKYFLINKQYGE